MIPLTVEEQNRVCSAARKVGGYDNLIKLEYTRRKHLRLGLDFNLRKEIDK